MFSHDGALSCDLMSGKAGEPQRLDATLVSLPTQSGPARPYGLTAAQEGEQRAREKFFQRRVVGYMLGKKHTPPASPDAEVCWFVRVKPVASERMWPLGKY
jgi:hypothetical protein